MEHLLKCELLQSGVKRLSISLMFSIWPENGLENICIRVRIHLGKNYTVMVVDLP